MRLPKEERQFMEEQQEICGILSQANISKKNLARLKMLTASPNSEIAAMAKLVLEIGKVHPHKRKRLGFLARERKDLLAQLEEDLDAIPYIVGVNNHMGSKFTKDPERMTYVFERLKERGLFFVDSRTTTRTCSRKVARRMKLKFAQRQVFLDHLEEASFMRAQIKQLVSIARSRGSAIGIIHPHRLTYRIIKEALPRLKKSVEIVPVSQLVN